MLYRVTWEIDIEAQTPEVAARDARRHQLNPNAQVGVFVVRDDHRVGVKVDLDEGTTEPLRPRGAVVDGVLRCPAGHDGPFRYLETIQNHRRVSGLSGPVLEVEGLYETGEGYDEGEDGHLQCHAETAGAGGGCLVEFDVPPGIEIGWV